MNLNPFDLRGPEFLVFFMCLITGTVILVLKIRSHFEGGTRIQIDSLVSELARDPYQIAFLRGGQNEVIRMAIVSLLDRGLIRARQNTLVRVRKDIVYGNQHPLDKAILTKLSDEEQPAEILFSDGVIAAEARMIGSTLRQKKLLPDGGIISVRVLTGIVTTAIFWGMAAAKIYIALSRGRKNIEFLVILALFAPFVVSVFLYSKQTMLGRRVSKKLQLLFSDIQTRRKYQAITSSNEFLFLGAAFGLSVLPNHVMETLNPLHLYPEHRKAGGSGCGGGSSCSGGSSCGGGCGGGCGGCGG